MAMDYQEQVRLLLTHPPEDKPQRYSARPSWLPYSDGRPLTPVRQEKLLDLDEELAFIWRLVDNNACDFEKASKRWDQLWLKRDAK